MSSTPPPIPPADPHGQQPPATPPQPPPYGSPSGQYPQYPPHGAYPQHPAHLQQQPGYPPYAGYPQHPAYGQHPGYYAQPPAPQTHSTAGKISVAIALVGWAIFAVSFAAAAITGQQTDPNSPQAQVIGLGIMGAMGLNVIGVFLAIGAFLEKNKKRGFAWAGLLMNAIPCMCGLGLMALGLAVLATGFSP